MTRVGTNDKVFDSCENALSDMVSGDVVGIAGFGVIHGFPVNLIAAVRDLDLKDLVIVCNSLGNSPAHPMTLVEHGQVRKLVAAFSARAGGVAPSATLVSPVPLEVELVPQGILVERLRATAAGLGPFYSPVGYDTTIADGKERREFAGHHYVLEEPLHLDFALIYAHKADRAGNVVFRGSSQNFAPSFAKGAKIVVAEVDDIVDVGDIAPEEVCLPGIFVDRVVRAPTGRTPTWRTPRHEGERREYLGRPALSASQMAAAVAALLPDGTYVNLGSGLPTLVSDHLSERDVVLHAENGLLGYGGRVDFEHADIDLYNAGAEPVILKKGASVFDSVEAFEIARSGRLDAVVLGAYQVDGHGSFSNWTTPGMGGGAIGGAMDLLVRPGRVIVVMRHCERSGRPKIVRDCQYPLTGARCVDLIVTDVAVIERDERGLVLRECALDFTPDEVQRLTEVPLVVDLSLDACASSEPGRQSPQERS